MRNYKVVWTDKRISYIPHKLGLTKALKPGEILSEGVSNRFIIPSDVKMDGL